MSAAAPRVILVADFDEATRRETVELIEHLARAGKHRVTLQHTGDGTEAMRLAEKTWPDLLITEVLLPGLSGMELIRRMTDRERSQSEDPVPSRTAPAIMVLTELTAEIDRFWALRNGAIEYLTKPCPPDLLRDRVLKFFSGSMAGEVSFDSWLPSN